MAESRFGSTVNNNRSQVMSPNSAQGQSTSELTADEQLDILLREHERKQKERNAQHVHQTDQVFRALQLPQQEHLAPITSTSASSLPPSSAAIAPPIEGSTSALRETGSLILETAENGKTSGGESNATGNR